MIERKWQVVEKDFYRRKLIDQITEEKPVAIDRFYRSKMAFFYFFLTATGTKLKRQILPVKIGTGRALQHEITCLRNDLTAQKQFANE